MNILTPYSKRLAGFSLVEMAIVILIAGIMMGAGLSLLAVKQAAAQADVTQKHQETIKQALINYLGKNRRLPCPADPTVTPITGAELRPTTPPTTLPPCTQYSGIVPYQELGLDRATVLDGWENFITYVVSPPIVPSTSIQPATPAPLLTTAWLYTYSATLTPTNTYTNTSTPANPGPLSSSSNYAFWPSSSTGGITVMGDNGITIANPAIANPTGAAVALISYGKNGYGAFNVKGGTNDNSKAGADEKTNAIPVTGTSPLLTAKVFKRDATDSATATGGPFDDIVMILNASDLTGPLIANGTLQASAQAALSQANDAVIGNILASRSCSLSSTTQNSAAPVCITLVCTTYDTATPPNCIGSVCTAYSTYNTSSTSSTNICTYGIPASFTFTTPPNVVAWGVKHTQVISTISASTTPSANAAYTLTAGDGSTKTVSIGELQGILARAAGFTHKSEI